GKKELEDAREEIADAEKEIEDNEKKLADGWKEYEDGVKEFEEEIADAEKEIADAEKEIEDLKEPEWMVSDRSDLPDNIGYGENADRMRNIGQVFPVLFFLVAALISLTTMTRMVEEERTQIGTLKALGYSKGAIASKYLGYALIATLAGSIVGVLLGEKFLPFVIVTAYKIIYHHIPNIELPYNMKFAVIAVGAALVSTLGATLAACYKELASTPAVLMRPPAPKEGKRVLLERVTFLWKHLSFTWKSTVRNLFRYKKRFFMTIFGIGGCMALMIVGYGLRDSIMDIANLQFKEIQVYDAMVILDTESSAAAKEDLEKQVSSDVRVENYTKTMMQKDTVQIGKKLWDLYVMVPENVTEFMQFVNFRDRVSGETYELTDEGAILTEKIASELGLKVGDTISIEDDESGTVEVPVAAITENYLSHYIYLTPALYEKCFHEEPEYNEILFRLSEDAKEQLLAVGEEFLSQDAALSVSYTETLMGQLDDMLEALDAVMIVLIISAGLLAFVVLYNLNNININERKRELATIKVLGFYDGEVSAYVYRENILITIIGIFAGVVLGIILHRFVIVTVEVDACMFGRNINLPSFLISSAFTVAFSIFVNVVMHFKLKKIDMVESLKSVE
ncbi:MAG: FtsX-like permease family protein, partial [Eubacteriales bacterium]|nr:FtsX-like permease family protein [Eubacteriales bacterium]